MNPIMLNIILISLSLSYLSMFYSATASVLFVVLAIIIIYFNILFGKNSNIENILILSVYNQVIMPVLRNGNNKISTLVIFIGEIIPVFLILSKSIIINRKIRLDKDILLSLTYLMYLLARSLYNVEISSSIIKKSLLPLAVFVFYYLLSYDTQPNNMKVNNIKKILRSALLSSLIVFFLPGYIGKIKVLFESGYLTKVPITVQYYMLGYLPRNMGMFFEARLLGIFSYLFLYYVFKYRDKYIYWDFLIAFMSILTSFTRGSIVVSLFIIGGYICFVGSNKRRYKKVFFAFCLFILFIISIYYVTVALNVDLPYLDFLKTLNIANGKNAVSQRAFFAERAYEEFEKNPIWGNGVGWISSKDNIELREFIYPVISDAYYHILLAEIGLTGLLFFIYLVYRIFNIKDGYNMMFFFGVAIHLYGTDIPNFEFHYIAILILIFVGTRLSPKLLELDRKETL